MRINLAEKNSVFHFGHFGAGYGVGCHPEPKAKDLMRFIATFENDKEASRGGRGVFTEYVK
jgi:hypothetical protein